MLEAILIGSGFAFAAAMQPGPLMAFLLSRTATIGWKRTLPASVSPLLSDIPIALSALLVIGRLPASALPLLRAAGGVLLLYLAWITTRQARQSGSPSASDAGSAPRTVLQAALVNVLNPGAYLGWALVLGPALVGAWQRHPGHAVALLVAFYITMVPTLAGQVWLLGTARFLGPRTQHALAGASAAILAALGIYQLVVGTTALLVP